MKSIQVYSSGISPKVLFPIMFSMVDFKLCSTEQNFSKKCSDLVQEKDQDILSTINTI